jgi:hypothetical protein
MASTKKLTGAQSKARELMIDLLVCIEKIENLERDAAIDLTNILSLISSARYRIARKFDLE